MAAMFRSRSLRGFSPGTPFLPSPQKPIFPNSNSTRNQVDEEPLSGCATSLNLLFYLFMSVRFGCWLISRPEKTVPPAQIGAFE